MGQGSCGRTQTPVPCLGHQLHKDLGASFAVCPGMPSSCFGSPLRAGGAQARRGRLCFRVFSPVLLQPMPLHRSSRPRAFNVFTEYFAFVFKRLEQLQSKHC